MQAFQRIARIIRPAIALPVLAALGLAGLMVLSLGCGPNKDMAAATAPAINPRLPDVPVPFGFKFNTGDSYDRVSGEYRSVKHLYEGSAPLRQVTEFYRQQMPAFGWTLREENFGNGTQRFVFSKGADVCYVSIWDSWGMKVLIQVMPVGVRPTEPAGRTAAPKPAGP
ncbi:MAG: hypothetical protein FJ288_14580 [Planctomycetes bacterium]|nr:hypothetical protein [Planctomycetota bacterium]